MVPRKQNDCVRVPVAKYETGVKVWSAHVSSEYPTRRAAESGGPAVSIPSTGVFLNKERTGKRERDPEGEKGSRNNLPTRTV